MRILAIILSLACGGAYGYWASQPVWSATGYTSTQYLGFDDQRQVLYSLVERDQRWWIDRRDLGNGALVSVVSVAAPASIVGKIYCVHNHLLGHENGGVTVVGERRNNQVVASFFLEIATGKCTSIEHENAGYLDFNDWHLAACFGNRCAMPDNIRTMIDKEKRMVTDDYGILLVDSEHQKPRRIKFETYPLSFAIINHRYLIVALEKELQLIDWNTTEVISRQKINGAPRYQIGLSSKGRIYLCYYDSKSRMYFQRFQISNSTLQPCGAALPLPVSPFHYTTQLGGMLFEEDDKGKIHFACYCAETWPHPWRTILIWLSQHGWKINSYFPTKMLYAKYVINARDEVIEHYETPFWTERFILEQFQVFYQDSTIQVFKTSAVWPNAMAVVMVVYLALYIWRHRKVSVA